MDIVQHWYFNSFFKLSRSRQFGFNGPQPISMQEIKSFLDMEGVEKKENREKFMDYITYMDQVFIENEHGR